MIKNYFKTAFRSLWRNKQFSVINIAGLALGITVFLLITQYVAFEWSANRFNKNFNDLYRANVMYKEGNTDYHLPPGFAPIIKDHFPAIKTYTRVADDIGAGALSYNANAHENKLFKSPDIKYVDNNFLETFSFPLIAGANTLKTNTLALSQPMKEKLFGDENANGKTVTVSNQFGNTLYTVQAVYQQPKSSDIKADVLLSLQTLENAANRDGNDWADPNTTDNGFTSIYVLLQHNANAPSVAQNITTFLRSINPDSKNDIAYLQPLHEMHLAPSFNYPYQTYGNLLLVTVFAVIAVLILLIAWLNYINLSTAQALNRAKETGVRKILGASRNQLMFQHLTETLIITITSAFIAMLLVMLLQNLFNNFTGEQLSLAVLNNGLFWLFGIAMIVIGSFFAGSYVAFVLTSFKPATAIRGKGKISIKGISVRKALVVFQFAVSIIFIIATTVLYKQLQYMKTENLGMNLKQLLVIQGPTIATENQSEKNDLFKSKLAQLPYITKVTGSNSVPGIGYNFQSNGINKVGAKEIDKRISYSMFICDNNFFNTYGIRFAQGNTFTKEDADRSWNNVNKVIINETAAKKLGFDTKQNIIGEKIDWGTPYEIIGVVKDYHHTGLRDAIQPTIYLGSVGFSFFTVQTDTRNLQSKIKEMKGLFNQTYPGNPFEYFFADEKYNQQYNQEQQLGKVFIASALIAVCIACLGLFGLAAFSAKQRTKEIGIRKVLGASVAGIASLLSKDFIRLIIFALIIASPVAYWCMNKWLQNFAYRTNISIWIFIISGCIAIIIALATISYQSIKAAVANPVKSLRTE